MTFTPLFAPNRLNTVLVDGGDYYASDRDYVVTTSSSDIYLPEPSDNAVVRSTIAVVNLDNTIHAQEGNIDGQDEITAASGIYVSDGNNWYSIMLQEEFTQ